MSIKTVLYDLDGTLLPMDTLGFVRMFAEVLIEKLNKLGLEGEEIMSEVNSGIFCMFANEGGQTNEKAFKEYMEKVYGTEQYRVIEEHLLDFYHEDFAKLKASCGFEEASAQIVELCKSKGLKQIVATNPLFPEIATAQRVAWAGLNFEDFLEVTTFENCSYCKPNIKYYEEILEKHGLKGEECLMVGTDVAEDLIASQLGMKVFLVTDNLINRSGTDIDKFPHGDFAKLRDFIEETI